MQLLEDGVPVKERGKTRSRGRIREIMILKAPVYDQDQIVGLIGFFMDITNTSKQINRLENEAARDDLTSLKNRHNFARDFNYLTGKPILAMMLDVDHFKKFNDKCASARSVSHRSECPAYTVRPACCNPLS